MPVRESEFKEYTQARQMERMLPNGNTHQQLLRQAVVDSKLLTQHPEWDRYLQRVQAILDDLTKDKLIWQEKYLNSYDEASRNKAQIEYQRHAAAIEVLVTVMTFPKELTNATS